MAFQAKDGKKSTNRAPMMQHNRSLDRMASKSEAGGAGTMQADPLAQPGEGGEMGQEDGSAVAEQHGPAQEIHMMHHHEEGRHEVHSMHPDGHQHSSEHGSVDEAHEHAKKLAGGGMEHQEPDGDEAQPEYE